MRLNRFRRLASISSLCRHLPHLGISSQILGDARKLLQRSLEALYDVFSQQIRRREILAVLKRLILQPENIQTELVALNKFVIGECLVVLQIIFRPKSVVVRIANSAQLIV
jgi:hypothetical protein